MNFEQYGERQAAIGRGHRRLRRRQPAVLHPVAPAVEKAKPVAETERLRRTFAIDRVCDACGGPLRLIALIKTEATIKKILTAMGLPAEPPPVHSARAPPSPA